MTDVLVSGRYVEAERSLLLRWRGSRNQQLHYPFEQQPPHFKHFYGMMQADEGHR